MKEARSAKVQLMIEPTLVDLIDDWRFSKRIGSRSHAMRSLMAMAIALENKNGSDEAATSNPSLNTTHP